MKAVEISSLLLISFIVAIALNSKPANAQTLLDTGAASSIGATVDSAPGVNAGSIRDRVRADLQQSQDNYAQSEREALGEPNPTPNSTAVNRQPPPLPPFPPKLSAEQIQELRKRAADRAGKSGNSGRMSSTTPPIKEMPPRLNDDNRAYSSTSPNGQKLPRPGDDHRFGSTTPPMFGKDGRPFPPRMGSTSPMMGQDGRPIPRDASTTPIFNRENQIRIEMRAIDTIRQRKENVAKQFEVAINNLTNLRKRIGTRIDKESASGIDMSKAKQLLATADAQLSQLASAIDTLKAYAPATSTIQVPQNSDQTQSNDQPKANLDGARKLVDDVHTAVKSSQKALSDVIAEIIRAAGQNHNSNTPPPPPTN